MATTNFLLCQRARTTSQIRQVLQESYPDLRIRARHLLSLIRQKQAAHNLFPTPNTNEGLEEYRAKDSLLKTLKAGWISFHEETPANAPDAMGEKDAMRLRKKLRHLAKIVDQSITYLDWHSGTYGGGLYKIGLITSVAGLLTLIPGVGFLAATILPAGVPGAQTVRLRIGRDRVE